MNPSPKQNKKEFVFDTSSLILLFQKCQLKEQLLKLSRKNKLCAPYRVMEEYFIGDDTEESRTFFQKAFTPIKADLAVELLPYFNFDSTPGEIWVISYALRNRESFCVVDEDFARNICRLFELRVTGAIGLISHMKELGLLTAIDLDQVRVKIRNSSFYLSKKLCDELDRICSR